MHTRNLKTLLLCILVVAARAESAESMDGGTAVSMGNTAAATAKTDSSRASSDIAAALSAEATESGPAAKPADSIHAPELSPLQKTQGEIQPATVPKLPAFLVLGSRVYAIKNGELLTQKGMVAQSFGTHPGLAVGNLFNLNAEQARQMFLADDWRNTKSDYWDMARAMSEGGDRAEGRMIVNAISVEDVRMRAEGDDAGSRPDAERFQPGQLGNNSRLLSGPEHPIDLPVVRMVW